MLYWDLYHAEGMLRNAKIMLTIHNMDNTGECRQEEFIATGVSGVEFNTLEKAMDERTIGHNPERLCLLKGAIVYSNYVTTVRIAEPQTPRPDCLMPCMECSQTVLPLPDLSLSHSLADTFYFSNS